MFCKICGKEINDNAVICPHCGCQVTSVESPVVKNEKDKINVLCLVGFVLACVSWLIALWGIVAIAGCTLSIVGIVQANRKNERLKGLGIAGIVVSGISLIYTIIVLSAFIILL